MNFDFFTLEVFLKITDLESFTKAAKELGRTQSAISQQMTKLESAVGKSLIKRGKKLTLTPEGEVFLHYAQKIYQLQREAIDHFQEPELKGEIRFGLPEDFASVFLSDVLNEFTQLHPRISIAIECDLTLNLYTKFKKNEFDLVLVKMNHPKEFPNSQEVCTEKLEWVGASSHLKNTDPIRLVLAPTPCVYRTSALQALEKTNQNWRLSFTSPSYNGTIAAVKAGLGITVLPRSMIPKDLYILRDPSLGELEQSHVTLLKHSSSESAVNSLEHFIFQKLRFPTSRKPEKTAH